MALTITRRVAHGSRMGEQSPPKNVGRGPEETMKPFTQWKTVPPECGRMQSLCGKAGCTRDEARDEARRISYIQKDMEIQNGIFK
ncbi:MAG: hypothetical protein ACUVXA_13365 [Candidatus Jordarchaeum sp.]|uniref:hypothetical protein n=1 Tax=Candidatus Jordarchaeum sp. TaxID=2823881 RepID=UPI00404B3610